MASASGHHRSLALAERHLRALEKQTGTKWEITSRRRADGQYSERGRNFTFEPVEEEPPEGDVFEWIINFTYKKSGRSFDVIVTARSEQEAFDVAKQFLRDDPQGQRIVRAGFHGWLIDPPARGEHTDEEAGEAEYRSKSRGKIRSGKH